MQIAPTYFPFLTAGLLPHCLQHHSEKGLGCFGLKQGQLLSDVYMLLKSQFQKCLFIRYLQSFPSDYDRVVIGVSVMMRFKHCEAEDSIKKKVKKEKKSDNVYLPDKHKQRTQDISIRNKTNRATAFRGFLTRMVYLKHDI